jgi:hypothetical protein
MSKRKAESQQVSASSDKKAKSNWTSVRTNHAEVCDRLFPCQSCSCFVQVFVDEEAWAKCMESTFGADLLTLGPKMLEDKDYASKLYTVLHNKLYKKGIHVHRESQRCTGHRIANILNAFSVEGPTNGKWDYLDIYCNTYSVYDGVWSGSDEELLTTTWFSDHYNEEKTKSALALVEKDLVDLGWSVVDWEPDEFFVCPQDYYCQHCAALDH